MVEGDWFSQPVAGLLWDRPYGAYLYGRRSVFPLCHVKCVYFFYFLFVFLLFSCALLVCFVIQFRDSAGVDRAARTLVGAALFFLVIT